MWSTILTVAQWSTTRQREKALGLSALNAFQRVTRYDQIPTFVYWLVFGKTSKKENDAT